MPTIDELKLKSDEHLFVRGASGSGKTALLNLLADIHTPTTGNLTPTTRSSPTGQGFACHPARGTNVVRSTTIWGGGFIDREGRDQILFLLICTLALVTGAKVGRHGRVAV